MTEFDITYHIEVSEETMDALLWDTLPGTDYWREGEFFDVEESASDNLIGFKIQLRDDLVEDSDPTPPVFRIDGDVWVRGPGVAREPMLSLDQLADLAWDKVPTEAERASIIEHFRSTPPESAYAQARHYMLTKRLADRYPDEYDEVTDR